MNKNTKRFVKAAHKAYHSKTTPNTGPFEQLVAYNQTVVTRRLRIGAVAYRPGRKRKVYRLREDLPEIC